MKTGEQRKRPWSVWHNGRNFVICYQQSWKYLNPDCQFLNSFNKESQAMRYIGQRVEIVKPFLVNIVLPIIGFATLVYFMIILH